MNNNLDLFDEYLGPVKDEGGLEKVLKKIEKREARVKKMEHCDEDLKKKVLSGLKDLKRGKQAELDLINYGKDWKGNKNVKSEPEKKVQEEYLQVTGEVTGEVIGEDENRVLMSPYWEKDPFSQEDLKKLGKRTAIGRGEAEQKTRGDEKGVTFGGIDIRNIDKMTKLTDEERAGLYQTSHYKSVVLSPFSFLIPTYSNILKHILLEGTDEGVLDQDLKNLKNSIAELSSNVERFKYVANQAMNGISYTKEQLLEQLNYPSLSEGDIADFLDYYGGVRRLNEFTDQISKNLENMKTFMGKIEKLLEDVKKDNIDIEKLGELIGPLRSEFDEVEKSFATQNQAVSQRAVNDIVLKLFVAVESAKPERSTLGSRNIKDTKKTKD